MFPLYTSVPSDFQVMTGPLINPVWFSLPFAFFLAVCVNLVENIRSASSPCVLIFQNDPGVLDLFIYLYFNHTESGILYHPPLPSLHPQGLNNFKNI